MSKHKIIVHIFSYEIPTIDATILKIHSWKLLSKNKFDYGRSSFWSFIHKPSENQFHLIFVNVFTALAYMISFFSDQKWIIITYKNVCSVQVCTYMKMFSTCRSTFKETFWPDKSLQIHGFVFGCVLSYVIMEAKVFNDVPSKTNYFVRFFELIFFK